MKIKQLYSAFGWHLKGELMKKYNLVPANNQNEPVLFLGAYGEYQIQKAINWSKRSKVIIWWSGGDVAFLVTKSKLLNELKACNNITHVATVNFIERDLQKVNIPYKKIPLFSHRMDKFNPMPLGDSIYVYHPNSSIYCPRKLYNPIREKFKSVPFLEARNHHTYTQSDIFDIYSKSFLGLRFTKHDGLSHTVCEMGLLGRKMICNADAPNCINYTNLNSILLNIEQALDEKNKHHGMWLTTAQEMHDYLDVGEDWLDV